MIRGILFDKDGTLVDFAATWEPLYRAAAVTAAAGDHGLADRLLILGGANVAGGAVAPDSVLASGTTREIAEAWVDAGCPWSVTALTTALDAHFQAGGQATMRPVTDLETLFGRLKARGLKLGIASSDSRAGIDALVERCGLGGHVDFIAGWDSGHGAKPAPGMVLAFAAATGLEPSAIAIVGDNRHDMAMGAAAGAGLLVGVLTGTGTRETLSPAAHFVLASIAELEGILEAEFAAQG